MKTTTIPASTQSAGPLSTAVPIPIARPAPGQSDLGPTVAVTPVPKG